MCFKLVSFFIGNFSGLYWFNTILFKLFLFFPYYLFSFLVNFINFYILNFVALILWVYVLLFTNLFILFFSFWGIGIVYFKRFFHNPVFFDSSYFNNFSCAKLQIINSDLYNVYNEQSLAFNSIFRLTRILIRSRLYHRKTEFHCRRVFATHHIDKINMLKMHYRVKEPWYYAKSHKELWLEQDLRRGLELLLPDILRTPEQRYRLFTGTYVIYFERLKSVPRRRKWKYHVEAFKPANTDQYIQAAEPADYLTTPASNSMFLVDFWNFLFVQLKLYLNLETFLFFNFLPDLAVSTFFISADWFVLLGSFYIACFPFLLAITLFFVWGLYKDIKLFFSCALFKSIKSRAPGFVTSSLIVIPYVFFSRVFFNIYLYFNNFANYLNAFEFYRFKKFTYVIPDFLNLKIFDRFKKLPYNQSKIYTQNFEFSTTRFVPLVSTYPGFESWDTLDYMLNPIEFNTYYSNHSFNFETLPSVSIFRSRPGLPKFKNRLNSFFLNEYSFPFTYIEENFTNVSSYVNKYIYFMVYGVAFPFLFFFELFRFVFLQVFLGVRGFGSRISIFTGLRFRTYSSFVLQEIWFFSFFVWHFFSNFVKLYFLSRRRHYTGFFLFNALRLSLLYCRFLFSLGWLVWVRDFLFIFWFRFKLWWGSSVWLFKIFCFVLAFIIFISLTGIFSVFIFGKVTFSWYVSIIFFLSGFFKFLYETICTFEGSYEWFNYLGISYSRFLSTFFVVFISLFGIYFLHFFCEFSVFPIFYTMPGLFLKSLRVFIFRFLFGLKAARGFWSPFYFSTGYFFNYPTFFSCLGSFPDKAEDYDDQLEYIDEDEDYIEEALEPEDEDIFFWEDIFDAEVEVDTYITSVYEYEPPMWGEHTFPPFNFFPFIQLNELFPYAMHIYWVEMIYAVFMFEAPTIAEARLYASFIEPDLSLEVKFSSFYSENYSFLSRFDKRLRYRPYNIDSIKSSSFPVFLAFTDCSDYSGVNVKFFSRLKTVSGSDYFFTFLSEPARVFELNFFYSLFYNNPGLNNPNFWNRLGISNCSSFITDHEGIFDINAFRFFSQYAHNFYYVRSEFSSVLDYQVLPDKVTELEYFRNYAEFDITNYLTEFCKVDFNFISEPNYFAKYPAFVCSEFDASQYFHKHLSGIYMFRNTFEFDVLLFSKNRYSFNFRTPVSLFSYSGVDKLLCYSFSHSLYLFYMIVHEIPEFNILFVSENFFIDQLFAWSSDVYRHERLARGLDIGPYDDTAFSFTWLFHPRDVYFLVDIDWAAVFYELWLEFLEVLKEG